MRWSIVQTIWYREVRDQLRDRRTVFMVVILPILLYPALTLLMLQFFSAFTEKEVLVGLVGEENLFEVGPAAEKDGFNLERLPPLLALSEPTKPRYFHASLFDENSSEQEIAQFQRKLHIIPGKRSDLQPRLQRGELHLLLEITPEMARKIRLGQRTEIGLEVYTGHDRPPEATEDESTTTDYRKPLLTSDERTNLAYDRLYRVLQRW